MFIGLCVWLGVGQTLHLTLHQHSTNTPPMTTPLATRIQELTLNYMEKKELGFECMIYANQSYYKVVPIKVA